MVEMQQKELCVRKRIYSSELNGIDVDKMTTLDGSFQTLSSNFAYSAFFPAHFRFLTKTNPTLYKVFERMIKGQTLIEFGCFKRPLECLWQLDPREVHLVDPNLNYEPQKDIPFKINLHKEDALSFLRGGIKGNTISVGMFGDEIIEERYANALAKAVFASTPEEGYSFHAINDEENAKAFCNAGFRLVGKFGPNLRPAKTAEYDNWIYHLFRN